MKKYHLNKQKSIKSIYFEIKDLYTLYRIQQESLYFCHEENLDYGHIFAIDTIYSEKMKKLLKNLEKFVY